MDLTGCASDEPVGDAVWRLVAERDEMRAALVRLAASTAGLLEGQYAPTQLAVREHEAAIDAAVQLGDRLRGASDRRVEDADPEAP